VVFSCDIFSYDVTCLSILDLNVTAISMHTFMFQGFSFFPHLKNLFHIPHDRGYSYFLIRLSVPVCEQFFMLLIWHIFMQFFELNEICLKQINILLLSSKFSQQL